MEYAKARQYLLEHPQEDPLYNKATCAKPKLVPAAKLEEQVWHVVKSIMQRPEALREGLEAMVEERRRELSHDPDREI